jgi:hypothetical protein
MKRRAKLRKTLKTSKTRARYTEMDAAIAAIRAVADEVKPKRRSQKVNRAAR